MVKFVTLLILLGLIVAPANCRVPQIGDNVTIVVGFNGEPFSGIINDMSTNFICIESVVSSITLDYCIGTGTIQYLMWNDQQDLLAIEILANEKREKVLQEASNTSRSEFTRGEMTKNKHWYQFWK
jgi:hypothetical protein